MEAAYPVGVQVPAYVPPPGGDLLGRYLEKIMAAPSRESLRYAKERIREYGAEAGPRLAELVAEGIGRQGSLVLVNLCQVLGASGFLEGAQTLLEVLQRSPVPIIRSSAVDAIRELGANALVPELIEAVAVEPEPGVMNALLRAIAELGGEQAGRFFEGKLEAWLGQSSGVSAHGSQLWQGVLSLDDPGAQERLERLGAKVPAGPFGVQALLRRVDLGAKGLEDELRAYLDPESWPSPAVRETAVLALAGLGDWEAVLGAAADPEPKVWLAVAEVLRSEAALEADVGREELRRFAEGTHPVVGTIALIALVARGERHLLEPWLRRLREYPSGMGSTEAVKLLVEPGLEDPRTLPILLQRWPVCGLEERFTILRAAAKLGQPESIPFVIDVIRNPEERMEVRRLAVTGLGNYGAAAVAPLAELWAEDLDTQLAEPVLYALAGLAKHAPVKQILEDLVTDPSADDLRRRLLFELLPIALGSDAHPILLRAWEETQRSEVRAFLDGVLGRYY